MSSSAGSKSASDTDDEDGLGTQTLCQDGTEKSILEYIPKNRRKYLDDHYVTELALTVCSSDNFQEALLTAKQEAFDKANDVHTSFKKFQARQKKKAEKRRRQATKSPKS